MNYQINKSHVINELNTTLDNVSSQSVEQLLEMIESADRVFFVGVGRVLLSLQAMAKRLAHLGIQTCIVGQITEPAITANDLLIVGSGSGESMFPLGIARKAKTFHARVAHIGANPQSSMKDVSDLFIRIPVKTKLNLPSETPSIQPMTSLFEQSLLLLGDILALLLIEKRHINMESLWQFHANLE
ncbi:sugar isomerase [Superficieibacter electus]|uniref:Sugar isomerase n=1 Tax=Superficieibacter electus TaxID=2022662 RepID=A0A2P5GPJ5_9ENTR|nr:6-phospho-3-hexuloisomerase [Superficieibacter electus]POP45209.1 sugar isomerase [Superficieibacter electus]POP48493.1 sugar isomerase [Superficieibacter electus]